MGNYATSADVVAAGAPPGDYSTKIAKWEAIVEELTGNIFYELEPGEIAFDGNNSRTLFFSIPLIAVTSLKVNGSTLAADTSLYTAYTGRTRVRDDRKNPRIELVTEGATIFNDGTGLRFLRGQSQKVTAKWGYVDDDGQGGYITPPLIKEAVVALVIFDLESLFDQYAFTGAGGKVPVGAVKSERTDGHSITYGSGVDKLKVGWSFLPRDIAEVLSMFRAPPAMEAPAESPASFTILSAW